MVRVGIEETEGVRMSDKDCRFYNKVFCNPCKSPNDFDSCVLVKIGMQIVADRFIDSIPESKRSEYVELGFYLNNLKNQRRELIEDFIKDLDYWINTNREGIDSLYILKDIKSK